MPRCPAARWRAFCAEWWIAYFGKNGDAYDIFAWAAEAGAETEMLLTGTGRKSALIAIDAGRTATQRDCGGHELD